MSWVTDGDHFQLLFRSSVKLIILFNCPNGEPSEIQNMSVLQLKCACLRTFTMLRNMVLKCSLPLPVWKLRLGEEMLLQDSLNNSK